MTDFVLGVLTVIIAVILLLAGVVCLTRRRGTASLGAEQTGTGFFSYGFRLAKPAAVLAIYLLFLWMLWLFRDDVPIWKDWVGNWNFFLASQAAIVAIALVWKLGSGGKAFWAGVLLVAPLVLFIVTKAPKPAPDEVKSRAASRVTVVPITATFEGWSNQVIIPPSSWSRIDSETACVLVKNVRGKVFDLCPGQRLPLGDNNITNFAFSFKAKYKGETVPVRVYHEPK